MSKIKEKVDIKEYMCTHPFTYSEFHRKWDGLKPIETQFVCCPDWNNVNIRVSDNLQDNWNSKEAYNIRKGHLNGEFTGCSPVSCPALNTLVNTGKLEAPIIKKKDFTPDLLDMRGPKRVKVCSDDACNLKCPTCRSELRPNTPEKTDRTRNLLDSIERDYGATLQSVFTSGGGDPFYSTPMREWLQSMNSETFPSLNEVILHTNGILFTPKIWEKMKRIHPHVKIIEISIDAARKDTYENKTRLGGKWDVLMENLQFIKTIPTVRTVMLDFVVQKVNFKEMEEFVDMGVNIFGQSNFKLQINFQKVWPWPSLTPETYKNMCVWNPSHKNYKEFREELKKIQNYTPKVSMQNHEFLILHNLHEHDEQKLI